MELKHVYTREMLYCLLHVLMLVVNPDQNHLLLQLHHLKFIT